VRNNRRLSRLTSHFLPLTLLILGVRSPLTAQDDLVAERSAFALWLANAPDSPLAALAQQAIGTGLTLGPEDAARLAEGWPLAFESDPTHLEARLFDADRGGRREAWRGLVLAALAGLCVEVYLTRRLIRSQGLASA